MLEVIVPAQTHMYVYTNSNFPHSSQCVHRNKYVGLPHEVYHGGQVDDVGVVPGVYLCPGRPAPREPRTILLCQRCKPTLVVDGGVVAVM